jgi:hypothetical protein
MSSQIEIESEDVVERLVGITPMYLNNFLQRGLFGLRASVQAGEVRSKRRLFSREDVFAIALVWLLFESGLRTEPILRILNDLAGTKTANANRAAQKLLEADAEYLVVLRHPRQPVQKAPKRPEQAVKLATKKDLAAMGGSDTHPDVLLIPVGHKFADIKKRLQILYGGE